jgi:hypothetical protein
MNAVTLPEKLGKIVAQLETESEGIRLAAVSAMTRILQEHGLRWCQVSITAETATKPQDKPRQDRDDPSDGDPFGGRGWRDVAVDCQRFPHLVNRWEQDFLSGLPRFSRLSGKQTQVLIKIMVRLRACGCRV